MKSDEDLRVRFTVAERCPVELLPHFLEDEDELVQASAKARLEAL
jgi:hypothetical protein